MVRFNNCYAVACSTVVTVLALRMQDVCRALGTLLNEFCSAQDTEILFLEHVREVTTFWAKTVAVDNMSFAGHRTPLLSR